MVGWFLQTGRGLLQVHISFRDFIAVTAAIVTVVGSTVVFHPPFIPWVKGVMVVYSVLAFLLFLFGFLTHFRLQESKHRWIRNIHSVIPKVIKVSPLNACLLMLASASLLFISLLWPTPDKRQIAQQMLNDRGMTSYNYETSNYTGLFFAGEASASPGLSGWVEGSIQTALQSVGGILKYLNDASPTIHEPSTQGVSFALHAHPGDKPLT